MMHIKFFASNHLYFVAQAKSQESARARTEKAWWRASKKGQCAASMIGKLVCISMMMLFIAIANYKIFDKFYMQQVGIYSTEKAAGKCHQRQIPWRTADKVSQNAYRTCKTPNKMRTYINVCETQCKESAQKRENELEANLGFARSQKPSPVSGRIKLEHVKMEAKISKKGLVTPQSKFGRQQTQRLQKIRRLARSFRRRRQQSMRLMAKNKGASRQQQEPIGRRNDEALAEATASIKSLLNISSSSDSSSGEFDAECKFYAGVHTSGKQQQSACTEFPRDTKRHHSTASGSTETDIYTDKVPGLGQDVRNNGAKSSTYASKSAGAKRHTSNQRLAAGVLAHDRKHSTME